VNDEDRRGANSHAGIIVSMSLSEEEWVRLRKTIQSGVANGVLIAGLVLMLLSFALGVFVGALRI
jgi:hypothetical protein